MTFSEDPPASRRPTSRRAAPPLVRRAVPFVLVGAAVLLASWWVGSPPIAEERDVTLRLKGGPATQVQVAWVAADGTTLLTSAWFSTEDRIHARPRLPEGEFQVRCEVSRPAARLIRERRVRVVDGEAITVMLP